MIKWINKAVVITITITNVYLFSDNLLTFINPYIINGWIGTLQLFTFGFTIGYIGGMTCDNILRFGINYF